MKLGMPVLIECSNVLENIQLANELGLDFVELNLNFPYCQNINIDDLKTWKKEYNIFYTLHFLDNMDFGILSDTIREGYINYFEEMLNRYHEVGIQKMNIHLELGGIVTLPTERVYINERYYELYEEKMLVSIQRLMVIANRYQVELCIENVKSAPYFDLILEKLKHTGIHFTYDVGHDFVDSRKYMEYINQLQLPVTHMHLHDSTLKNNHLEIGYGNVDIIEQIEYAKANDMTVVLEVKTKDALVRSVKKIKNTVNVKNYANA